MRHEVVDSRAHTIVKFCRFVRERGLPGGLHRTMSALRAVKSIGKDDRVAYACALRAALCSSKMEWDLFDELLAAFQYASLRSQTSDRESARKPSGPGVGAPGSVSPHVLDQVTEGSAGAEGGGKAVSGASVEERLKKVDFSEVPHDDLVALEELSLRLLRQMSLRLSRRHWAGYRPGPVDLRRTIRRNLPHGGDLIELAFKNKRPRLHRLVILLDVSGSMNSYSLFL